MVKLTLAPVKAKASSNGKYAFKLNQSVPYFAVRFE